MSIFLVSALNSLGFGALLTAVMVVALDGWSSGNVVNMAFAPVLHLAASLVVGVAEGPCVGRCRGLLCNRLWLCGRLHVQAAEVISSIGLYQLC